MDSLTRKLALSVLGLSATGLSGGTANAAEAVVAQSPETLYLWAALIIAALEFGALLILLQRYKQLKQEFENTSRKTQNTMSQFENQAFYDPLTQLPNRRLFRDRLLQTMKLATRHKTRFCVVMADLDKFKPINDTLGHDAGDMLLKQVVIRLQNIMRESDTIARYGGDEFAFVCPSLQDRGAIATLCMRILTAIQEPFTLQGKEYYIGISMGIAVFPEHGLDEEVLIRHADTALYRAKEKRNTFIIYDPKLDTKMS
ncbi:diguanylate cyclase domain-containing protein [Vampirovibrio sp.]|uniref:diguanylate cyclase domain-containing protein n=1 Tax=Vampirovibrio sp. TaxID=2717857 RepID=UPI003592F1F3